MYPGLPNNIIEERQDIIFRKVRGILNKITPETFDKLSKELINVGLDSPRTLKGVIYLLFDKALKDLKYSSLYAKLCQELSSKAPNFEVDSGPNTFCKFLISKCEDEFERRRKATEDFDGKNELTDEEYEQKAIAKLKMLGNIKFICELGKKRLLQEEILHECIRGLLSKKKERPIQDQAQDLECLCQIMRTIGSLLDVQNSRNLMNQYFDRIEMFSKKSDLPSRIRFMLKDVIDLRNNNWRPRPFQREDNVPQPLSKLREEAGLSTNSTVDKLGNTKNILGIGNLSRLHGSKLSSLLSDGDEPSYTTSSDFHWGSSSFLHPDDQAFDVFNRPSNSNTSPNTMSKNDIDKSSMYKSENSAIGYSSSMSSKHSSPALGRFNTNPTTTSTAITDPKGSRTNYSNANSTNPAISIRPIEKLHQVSSQPILSQNHYNSQNRFSDSKQIFNNFTPAGYRSSSLVGHNQSQNRDPGLTSQRLDNETSYNPDETGRPVGPFRHHNSIRRTDFADRNDYQRPYFSNDGELPQYHKSRRDTYDPPTLQHRERHNRGPRYPFVPRHEQTTPQLSISDQVSDWRKESIGGNVSTQQKIAQKINIDQNSVKPVTPVFQRPIGKPNDINSSSRRSMERSSLAVSNNTVLSDIQGSRTLNSNSVSPNRVNPVRPVEKLHQVSSQPILSQNHYNSQNRFSDSKQIFNNFTPAGYRSSSLVGHNQSHNRDQVMQSRRVDNESSKNLDEIGQCGHPNFDKRGDSGELKEHQRPYFSHEGQPPQFHKYRREAYDSPISQPRERQDRSPRYPFVPKQEQTTPQLSISDQVSDWRKESIGGNVSTQQKIAQKINIDQNSVKPVTPVFQRPIGKPNDINSSSRKPMDRTASTVSNKPVGHDQEDSRRNNIVLDGAQVSQYARSRRDHIESRHNALRFRQEKPYRQHYGAKNEQIEQEVSDRPPIWRKDVQGNSASNSTLARSAIMDQINSQTLAPLFQRPTTKLGDSNFSLRPSHNLVGRSLSSNNASNQSILKPFNQGLGSNDSNSLDVNQKKQAKGMVEGNSCQDLNMKFNVTQQVNQSESKHSADDKSNSLNSNKTAARDFHVNKFVAALTEYCNCAQPNASRASAKIKELKIPKSYQHECLFQAVKQSIHKTDNDRSIVSKLLNQLIPQVLDGSALVSSFKMIFEQMNALEVETPKVKSLVAGVVSQTISDNLISLEDLGFILAGGKHHPLFLLVLQKLEKSNGQAWLSERFIASKINLMDMLPEVDRTKDRLATALKDRCLGFLDPMLTIEPDLWAEMKANDGSPASVYRWIKENVDQSVQSTPTFAHVFVTCLLRYTHEQAEEKSGHHLNAKSSIESDEISNSQSQSNKSSPNNNNNNNINNVSDIEKEMLTKYQQVLQALLKDRQMQLATLYSLQSFYYNLDFPKGSLLRWFHMLYDLNIVDDDVFFSWKEEINDEFPGKGQALFQVNTWLNWLAEAESEEEEEV